MKRWSATTVSRELQSLINWIGHGSPLHARRSPFHPTYGQVWRRFLCRRVTLSCAYRKYTVYIIEVLSFALLLRYLMTPWSMLFEDLRIEINANRWIGLEEPYWPSDACLSPDEPVAVASVVIWDKRNAREGVGSADKSWSSWLLKELTCLSLYWWMLNEIITLARWQTHLGAFVARFCPPSVYSGPLTPRVQSERMEGLSSVLPREMN